MHSFLSRCLAFGLVSLTAISRGDEREQNAAPAEFSLLFEGGDTITGRPIKGSWEGFTLESGVLVDPVEIEPAQLVSARRLGPAADLPPDHVARLIFNNGDSLRGIVKSVAEDNVIIDTSYAGELTIPRIFIENLEVSSREELIFRDNGEAEGWTMIPESAWDFEGGRWRIQRNGYLGRKIKTPERFTVSFNLTWSSRPNFRLRFGIKDPGSPQSSHGYTLNIENSIQINRFSARHGNRRFNPRRNNAVSMLLRRANEAKVTLHVDKSDGRMAVLLNDSILVSVWRADTTVMNDIFEDGFQFWADHSQRHSIRDIQITRWDGTVRQSESRLANSPELELSDKDEEKGYQLLPLANGDTIIGKIQGIAANTVSIANDFRPLELPLDRLISLPLGTRDDQAIRKKGDVRATFGNTEDSLLFRLDKIENGRATVYTQNFGTAEIDLDVFSSLEFWPHRRELRRLKSSLPE